MGYLASLRSRASLAVAAVLLSAGAAIAQGPPPLPAIEFPIDETSIATQIAAAGATILILVFGIWVGFRFVKKLMRRVASSV